MVARRGTNVTLNCSDLGETGEEVKWSRQGEQLGGTSRHLALIHVDKSHSGVYTCIVRGNEKLMHVSLLVSHQPHVSAPLYRVSQSEGSSVQLDCEVREIYIFGHLHVANEIRLFTTEYILSISIKGICSSSPCCFLEVSRCQGHGDSDPVRRLPFHHYPGLRGWKDHLQPQHQEPDLWGLREIHLPRREYRGKGLCQYRISQAVNNLIILDNGS